MWAILTKPATLWSKWIQCNYLKGRIFRLYEIPSDCSWGIRKLLQLRTCFRNAVKVQIGDGRECSLFFDWWVGGSNLAEVEGLDTHIDAFGHNLTVNQWWCDGERRIPTAFRRR